MAATNSVLVGTTALSYQMMIEDKLLHAMVNAEMRGAYQVACEYAIVYSRFVGVKVIPERPLTSRMEHDEQVRKWFEFYFKLMNVWGTQITTNLTNIRSFYKEKDDDIPKMKSKDGKTVG